ncbi:ribonuclease H-like domain-containing protein, partial [Tanacetum coccineum]
MKKFYKKTGRRVRVDGKTPVGFDKKKLECFNCHNTSHFASECTAKGTHDGKKKRDSFYQHQEAWKQEKNQMGLLTMDDGIGPQEPEPSVTDDKSSEYSTCQSNDNAGSIETSFEHSIDPESEILRVPPEMYVSTPITTNEKGVSASKSKEVEPSCVSHIKTPKQPIKDQEELECYDEKRTRGRSKEAEVKKQRVCNTGNMMVKPVWTNTNRINHANQFVPRPVQLNT